MLGNKKEKLKRPRSNLEFVLWKAIETRAGERLDHKQSGRDQTNAFGLTSLKNSSNVFEALLGVYPVGNEVNSWLSEEISKWDWLALVVYKVCCFLKSQKKR